MTTNDYYIQTRLNTIFDQSGESTSTLKLTLRNLSSKNFPASLTVNIHGDKIDLVSAKDDYGDVSFINNYNPIGINAITASFNRRMVGKDVLTHLTLIYKNPHAERSENTWVVFYPKISLDSPGDYVYNLTVPKSFGRLIATENMPEITSKSSDTQIYTLSGNTLPASSRMIFGDSYPYQFTLEYKDSSQITLPKDSESQKIYIAQISPHPSEVVQENNSWIAKFPQSQEKITVQGYAVFFNATDKLITDNLVNFESHPYQYLPAKEVSIAINPPKYFWPFIQNKVDFQIQNPNFQALYNVTLYLSTSGMDVTPPNPSITALPPAGSASFPVYLNFGLNSLFTPKKLQIASQNMQFSYNPSKDSLIFYYLIYSVIISAILIFTIYLAGYAWRLFVQRQRR